MQDSAGPDFSIYETELSKNADTKPPRRYHAFLGDL